MGALVALCQGGGSWRQRQQRAQPLLALAVLAILVSRECAGSGCPSSPHPADDGLDANCTCDSSRRLVDSGAEPCSAATAGSGACQCRCEAGFALYEVHTYDNATDAYVTTLQCARCPPGYFADGSGDARTCAPCPAGPGARTVPAEVPAASVAACVGCGEGFERVEYGDGRYGCECNGAGGEQLRVRHPLPLSLRQYVCERCPAGTFAEPARLRYDGAECTPCPEPADRSGNATGLRSRSECTCAFGHALRAAGAAAELLECVCPAGYEPVLDGKLNQQVCTACPTGSFKADAGNGACTPCGPFFYTDEDARSADDCKCPANMARRTLSTGGAGGGGGGKGGGGGGEVVGGSEAQECACIAGYFYQCRIRGGIDCDDEEVLSSAVDRDAICQPCVGSYKPAVGNEAECEPCPDDSDESVSGLTSIDQCVCPQSTKLSDDGSSCECAEGYYSGEGDSCQPCPVGEYKGAVGSEACTACPGGTTTADVGADDIRECICPAGQYLAVADWAGAHLECDDCPTGLRCAAGTTEPAQMGVRAARWRYAPGSNLTHACERQPAACVGSAPFSRAAGDALCAPGYMGPRCEACALGYGRRPSGACEQCPPREPSARASAEQRAQRLVNVALIAGVAAAVWLFIGAAAHLVARAGRHGRFAESAVADDLVPLFKIALNFLQVTAFSLRFELHWSEPIRGALGWLRLWTSPMDLQLRALDCEMDGGDARVWLRFVAAVAAVPVMGAAWVLFWAAACALALARERGAPEPRRAELVERMRTNAKVTVLLLLYVCHIPITAEALKLLSCEPLVDGRGLTQWHLSAQPSIRCLAPPHVGRMGAAGCVYLAVGLGIPAGLTALLHFQRRRLAEGSEAQTRFVSVYGFLFRGFEQHGLAHLWEVSVVMPRKVALLSVHTLLNQAPVVVQTLSALLVLFVIIVLHTRFQPYLNPSLDRVESLSLVSSFCTLFFGLYLLVNDTQLGGLPWLSATVTVLIIAMQAAMLLVFVHALLRVVLPQQIAKAAVHIDTVGARGGSSSAALRLARALGIAQRRSRAAPSGGGGRTVAPEGPATTEAGAAAVEAIGAVGASRALPAAPTGTTRPPDINDSSAPTDDVPASDHHAAADH